jgi:polygalacturonase
MSNVREFGAAGDGRTDDTNAILHALREGDGTLVFPRGDYLLSETIVVELDKTGRLGIDGSAGTAKIIMAGPGPAFHFLGTHDKTAEPSGFAPGVWARQRLPTVLNIEVEGRHPEACGFLFEGTMQSTLQGVLLRELLHGVRLVRRARNLLVSHCHVYSCRGVGVFLDHVNLHQAIITGSHISYCRQGGIKIVGSEIRNLQITGNDIEYNYDPQADASADVWIDSSDSAASVREATIVSNTIQARASPGGANVRIVGHNPQVDHKAGLLTLSGNLIGSQEINVHLVACRGVVLTGNVIYSGHVRNLQIEGSRNVVIGPTCLDHNPDYDPKELCTGVLCAESHDICFSGVLIQDCQAGEHTVAGARPAPREGLLEIVRCRRVSVSGCQFLDSAPAGVFIDSTSDVTLTGNTIRDTRAQKRMSHAIVWRGPGENNWLSGNNLGPGTGGVTSIDSAAGVKMGENLQAP